MRTLLTLLALLCAAPAAAQDTTLDRVQNLAATGRFTDARNTLDQWERQFADPRSNATIADRARALFLRATLTDDAEAAEDAFLNVVLSYPSSGAAPLALLRLGQALVTDGDATRAITYLERLRDDYPASSARETGALWLARAYSATGSSSSACAVAREGFAATRDENLRLLLDLERERACTQQSPKQPVSNTRPASSTPPRAPTPSATTTATFAVQAGAFRERASAVSLATQLRARGFDTRVVTVDDSPLYRVRFGSFDTSAHANHAAQRARDAGLTAIVVDDVARERVH